MRILCSSSFLILSVTTASLDAQALPHPDSLRPPIVTNAEAPVALAQAARLVLFQIREALNAGDPGTLAALVPDSLIPSVERNDARKCRTLSEALSHVVRVMGTNARGFTYLVVSDTSAIQSIGADIVMTEATLLHTRGAPPSIRFTFRRDGEALRLAGVQGLLGALCELSAQ